MEIEPGKLREMVREAYLEGYGLASGDWWTEKVAKSAWRASEARQELEEVLTGEMGEHVRWCRACRCVRPRAGGRMAQGLARRRGDRHVSAVRRPALRAGVAMTADSMTDLARRLVASPRWRWMPGMRATRAGPWTEPDAVRVPESLPNGGYPGWLPDLTDPATVGCLLSLVREALKDHELFARRELELGGPGWVVVRITTAMIIRGATEAEALVEALLHAKVSP